MLTFQQNGLLPAGIHLLKWEEIESLLGFNSRRQELLAGFKRACEVLKQAGCTRVYLDGSFATSKEFPGDFDGCWDDSSVDFAKLEKLDQVLLDFKHPRTAQKAKYGGELFIASRLADGEKTFLEFFQENRDGEPKGIIAIDL